jgi:hypothetical protein
MDVLVDREGKATALIIGVGGFLDLPGRLPIRGKQATLQRRQGT